MMQFNFFLKLLRDSFRDLLPIIVVILFFQLAIIQSVPEGWIGTAIGLGIVGVGLAIFLQGKVYLYQKRIYLQKKHIK